METEIMTQREADAYDNYLNRQFMARPVVREALRNLDDLERLDRDYLHDPHEAGIRKHPSKRFASVAANGCGDINAAKGVRMIGPRHCECCGKVERTTGCVRGMLCSCNQSLNGWCEVCRYCVNHCRCTDEMKAAAGDAHIVYLKALTQIAQKNPERINKH